jgi:hypothetical protein
VTDRRDPHSDRPAPQPPGEAPLPSPASPAAKIFAQSGNLDDFLRGLEQLGQGLGKTVASGLPTRVNADPRNVERGLAQLVLTLVELLRQLMERQAIRRMEGGSLSDEEVERLGTTFMLLERRMQELKKSFGLEDADLNIDLGPLGKLL